MDANGRGPGLRPVLSNQRSRTAKFQALFGAGIGFGRYLNPGDETHVEVRALGVSAVLTLRRPANLGAPVGIVSVGVGWRAGLRAGEWGGPVAV